MCLCEHMNCIALAPPNYELEPDFVLAVTGESPTIHFTVTSDNPMPENPKHTISREDGKAVRKKLSRIEGDHINLSEVILSDSGIYTIRCHDANGLEGKQTFELEITPGIEQCDVSV